MNGSEIYPVLKYQEIHKYIFSRNTGPGKFCPARPARHRLKLTPLSLLQTVNLTDAEQVLYI